MRTITLLLALTLAACSNPPQVAMAPQAPEANTSEPELAKTSAAGLTQRPASWTIAIDRDSISVVDRRLSDAQPEPLLELVGFKPTDSTRQGYLLTPLFERLSSITQAEKSAAENNRGIFEGALTLELHPETPFALIAQAIYTAGQAERAKIAFTVQTPDGPRHIPMETPKVGFIGDGDNEEGCGAAPCAGAHLALVEGGVMVKAVPVFGNGIEVKAERAIKLNDEGTLKNLFGQIDADKALELEKVFGQGGVKAPVERPESRVVEPERPKPRVVEPPTDWRGALMLIREGVCPSVPSNNDVQDLAGLRDLIERIALISPGCTTTMATATDNTPWRKLAPVLQTLRSMDRSVILTVSDRDDPTNCEGALLPEAFHPSDAPSE